MTSARDFLLDCGLTEKGFLAREKDSNTYAAATHATCLIALNAIGLCDKEKKEELIDCLFLYQFKDGDNAYSWCTDERSSIWATARCLYAALVCDPYMIKDVRILNAFHWLLIQKNDDGGFGYVKGHESRIIYTYYVFDALYLALTQEILSDSKKQTYESELTSIYKSVFASHISLGVWGNVYGAETSCFASSILAVYILRKCEKYFNISILDKSTEKHFFSLVCSTNNKDIIHFLYSEKKSNWIFDVYTPGLLDVFICVLGVEHEMVHYLHKFLLENFIIEDNYTGWTVPQNTNISIWVTAVSLHSLCAYSREWSHNATKKLYLQTSHNVTNESETKKNTKKIILYVLLLVSFILNICLVFDEYVKNAVVLIMSFLNRVSDELLVTVIGGILLLAIEEIFIGWIRKRAFGKQKEKNK